MNPVVFLRMHCNQLGDRFTVQFLLVTRRFTKSEDGSIRNDPIYLSPFRLWEEIDTQSIFTNVQEMGVQVLEYGNVQELISLDEANRDYSPKYITTRDDVSSCRLPESDSKWKIFQFVIFWSDCQALYFAFWEQFFLFFLITCFSCIFLIIIFMLFSRKYRSIMSFGYVKPFPPLISRSE